MADKTQDTKPEDTKPDEAKAVGKSETITIPGARTDSGKDEQREVKPTGSASLAESFGEKQPAEKLPVYKTLDFGTAGTLKVESVGQQHYGPSGSEQDVTVRVSKTHTETIPNVPSRLLKE